MRIRALGKRVVPQLVGRGTAEPAEGARNRRLTVNVGWWGAGSVGRNDAVPIQKTGVDAGLRRHQPTRMHVGAPCSIMPALLR